MIGGRVIGTRVLIGQAFQLRLADPVHRRPRNWLFWPEACSVAAERHLRARARSSRQSQGGKAVRRSVRIFGCSDLKAGPHPYRRTGRIAARRRSLIARRNPIFPGQNSGVISMGV